MSNPEIKEQAEIRIEDLPEFKIWKIRDDTSPQLFESIKDDDEKLKEFISKFDDIYYFKISPFDTEKYKDNEVISDILRHYAHTSEGQFIEVMVFKLKEWTEEQKKETLEKLRSIAWDNVRLDESKYSYIVWYYWWTMWRTNSAYMREIKEIYPVKTLK